MRVICLVQNRTVIVVTVAGSRWFDEARADGASSDQFICIPFGLLASRSDGRKMTRLSMRPKTPRSKQTPDPIAHCMVRDVA